MKTFLAVVLFLTSINSIFSNPNPEMLSEQGLDQLINKASRQNMLIQRVAKCYFAIGMNIEAKFYQVQLTDALNTYKKQLSELKSNAPNPTILEEFKSMEILFTDYSILINSGIERGNAQEVLDVAQQLNIQCDKAVLSLCNLADELPQNINSKIDNKEYTNLLVRVGQNRMITQKLPLLYLANLWEIGTANNKSEMDILLSTFSNNLQSMQKLKENTDNITEYIFSVMGEWRFIAEACLYLDEQNRAEAVRFLEKADTAANAIHKLAGLYEKLFNLDSGSLSNQGKN